MKEIKLKVDEYKNIDVRGLAANQFCKIKMINNGDVKEKTVTNKDGTTWTSYSLQVLHNGEENWLKLTGAVAKKLKKGKIGKVYTIFAIPSELKGGKAYGVSLEEDDEVDVLSTTSYAMTIVDADNFDMIIKSIKKRGLTLDKIDDDIVIKALSGKMGYSLENAELACKEFFKYAKDKF